MFRWKASSDAVGDQPARAEALRGKGRHKRWSDTYPVPGVSNEQLRLAFAVPLPGEAKPEPSTSAHRRAAVPPGRPREEVLQPLPLYREGSTIRNRFRF